MLFVTFVTLSVAAYGTYNPQTGRFLQQDPLGYVDGLSLYEYTRSSPVIVTDPMGGCGKPPHLTPKTTCKCFCIESLTLDGRTSNVGSELFLGAVMQVRLRGRWVAWDQEADGRANFQWWEWYTQVPNWHADQYAGRPTQTWQHILNYWVPQPEDTVWPAEEPYEDRPGHYRCGTPAFADQTAWFWIRAIGHPRCPCGYRNYADYFAYLRYKGNVTSAGIDVDVEVGHDYRDTATKPPLPGGGPNLPEQRYPF